MTNPGRGDRFDRIEALLEQQGQSMKLFVESFREYFAAIDKFADVLETYEQSAVDPNPDGCNSTES
jgi:hypothetical protein